MKKYQVLTALFVFIMLGVGPLTRPAMSSDGSSLPPDHPEVILAAAVQISSRDLHVCAITGSGGVKCWGDNGSGALGNLSSYNSPVPVDVTGLTSGVSQIAGGGYHTCALTNSGGVKCWGQNSDGQLGDNTTISRSYPVDVVGLSSGVAAIVAGGEHTCALTTAGGMKCWGDNSNYQIGNNSIIDRTTPADVVGLSSGVVAIAAGREHTCAVLTGGEAKCWGANGSRQLGDGTADTRRTPVQVSGLTSGVAKISGGAYHTCALTTTGSLKCWGSNHSGQLGIESRIGDYVSTPMDVPGYASNVADVYANEFNTCLLTASGGMKCWGRASEGQLGFDTTEPFIAVPTDVPGLTDSVTSIDVTGSSSCALKINGSVLCWGWNRYGQLGDGTFIARSDPRLVTGFDGGPIIPEIEIKHIEVTQVLQDSTTLVEDKPTFVRVYLNCLARCSGASAITGTLSGERDGSALPRSPLAPHYPIIPKAASDWTALSGDLSATLNFTLPPDWLHDRLRLTATVGSVSLTIDKNFSPAAAVDVLYVPVRIDGHAPNSSVIRSAHAFAEQIFPTAHFNYIPYPQTLDLATSCFALPPNYQNLRWRANCLERDIRNRLARLYFEQKMVDDPYVFGWFAGDYTTDLGYCGMSDPRWYLGTSFGKLAWGVDGANSPWCEPDFTLAHELGHDFGLHHSNTLDNANLPPGVCKEGAGIPAVGIDSNTDWPWSTSKIGKFGLDGWRFGWLIDSSSPSTLKNPTATFDLMSWCGRVDQNNVWIDDWTYEQIYQTTLRPPITSAAHTAPQAGTYWFVSGLVQANQTATIDDLWLVYDPVVQPPVGDDYCIDANNASGSTLSSHCFDLDFIDHDTGLASQFDGYNLLVPYDPTVSRIVLRYGASVLAEKVFSAQAPLVVVTQPNGGETWNGGPQTISWTASDPDGDSLTYSVYYSKGGGDWLPLSLGTTATQITVDGSALPGSGEARIRVAATDGANITSDESDNTLNVVAKAPQVWISNLQDLAQLRPNAPISLVGSAYDPEDGVLGDSSLHWSSDVSGSLGVGGSLVTSLPYGWHILTLSAVDSNGNEGAATVRVYVGFPVFIPLVQR